MKKLVIILMLVLCAGGVQGQGRRDDRRDGRRDRKELRRDGKDRRRDDRMRGERKDRRKGDYKMDRRDFDRRGGHDDRHRRMDAPRAGKAVHRNAVHCNKDWQILWNGYHVRVLTIGKIAICEKDGDRILQADEVYLLPNGYYKIRNGSFWYICEADGDRIFDLWGDAVEMMPDGMFRCLRAGVWRYYDAYGNERK